MQTSGFREGEAVSVLLCVTWTRMDTLLATVMSRERKRQVCFESRNDCKRVSS